MGRRTIGIIPARYASSRFAGKPLIDIAGKTMVRRVYEQAALCPALDALWIATDDRRIYDHARTFTDAVIMTAADCSNGTERVAEACAAMSEAFDFVINIQGDEPLLHPDQVSQLVELMQQPGTQIATLAHPLDTLDEDNPHVVKVTFDAGGSALGFSRDHRFLRHSADDIYQHVGLYAFQSSVLQRVVKLQPSPNERLERLEQLRWLDHGYRIRVGVTAHRNLSVDVPEDVHKILTSMKDNLHK